MQKVVLIKVQAHILRRKTTSTYHKRSAGYFNLKIGKMFQMWLRDTPIVDFTIAVGTVETKGWTDEMFLKEYAPKTLLKTVPMCARKAAALRLISYFSEGTSQQKPDPTATDIQTIIYTLSSPTEPGIDLFSFIFNDDSEAVLEVSASSSDVENGIAQNATLPIITNGFWRKAYTEIQKLTEADLKNKTRHLGLLYLSAIGFICLHLFQMLGCHFSKMKWFTGNSVFKVFQKFYKPPRDFLEFPLISQGTLENLHALFRYRNKSILNAFSLLVTGYLYFMSSPIVHEVHINVLLEGCLNRVMYYGMQPVELFEKVKKQTNLDHTKLKELLCCSRTIFALDNIMTLYEENSIEIKMEEHAYLPALIFKQQITWKWARLFHYRYYCSFSGSKEVRNLCLCARLAAILSMYPEHNGIDKLHIINSDGFVKNMFREEIPFAKAFFEKYGSTTEVETN